MKTNNHRIYIRKAKIGDVTKIVALEMDVWGDGGADAEKIISRIKVFPEGNIIAVQNNEIVGYVSIEFVDDVVKLPAFSWADITDNGKIAKSHKPNGEYVYGINLSVHNTMKGNGVGTALILKGWSVMILSNKRGAFIGSRIPGFRNYRATHPETDVESYINLKRNGKPRDYELRLYWEEGSEPVKIMPDYFPDPASLNYGVLVYRKNPFYNWPFRRLWAWAISSAAPAFIRKKLASASKGGELVQPLS